jgi:HAMP domain-containing protein/DNA-directed RNA polymerase subunit RPC12/RpoP
MLVICEDCAKKFDIDENRIKGERAKFTCNQCGHIIVVEKPPMAPPKKEVLSDKAPNDEQTAKKPSKTKKAPLKKGKGVSIRAYLLVTMIAGFVLISGAFAYLYLKHIPEIINGQIELRTSAITETFRGVISKPLLLRNYLQVNKEAQRTSMLPGVAYASVVNKKGIVIAGFFSDLTRFDRDFEVQVKEKGFPVSVLSQNKPGAGSGHRRITVGGQTIFDTVNVIGDSGGEVHVGIYVSDVDDAIRNALVSPVTISVFGAILLSGFLVLFFLTRMITKPTQQLTDIANRISLGELDLVITPDGPREMRALASAFERMRISIKAAVERLR